MKQTASTKGVSLGIVLGVLLQPVSLLIVLVIITVTQRSEEARGWLGMGAVFGYPTYFGMAQVLTILPAALLMLRAGKQGVARGLLYAGTLLALLNIATLIASYRAVHRI